MNEIWKEIPGYEGYFEVSNLGNFRSMDRMVKYKNKGLRKYPGKPLKVEQMQDGYQSIVLMKEAIKKRYMCHRLVALTFIDNPNNLPYVNHKDGDKTNNKVENLEWCTAKENDSHARSSGLKHQEKPIIAKNNETNETLTFKSVTKTRAFLGINKGTISKVLNGNRNQTHGYKFYFI